MAVVSAKVESELMEMPKDEAKVCACTCACGASCTVRGRGALPAVEPTWLPALPPPQEWLEALGVTDGGLDNLIRATYSALGLRTYFTSGGGRLGVT